MNLVPSFSQPTLGSTVAQLVLDRPGRSRVFHNLGIDFCCGGKRTLEEAASAKGLDPQTVLTMLLAMDDASAAEDAGPDVSAMSLAELCDHIVQTHHAYLRAELPRLHGMLEKVARGHGERFPHMREVLQVFAPFAQDLWQHMNKEEQALFPTIRALEAGDATATRGCGGSLDAPVRLMEHEHSDAGEALETMRRLTSAYAPPAGACNTFRAALDALAELERDMHRHVHKENHVLFPRAMELEQKARNQATAEAPACAIGG